MSNDFKAQILNEKIITLTREGNSLLWRTGGVDKEFVMKINETTEWKEKEEDPVFFLKVMKTCGPRGRVVKVADFSALNHSIISPLWVRASHGARVTCGTSQVLLAGVSGGFSPGTPVFAPQKKKKKKKKKKRKKTYSSQFDNFG